MHAISEPSSLFLLLFLELCFVGWSGGNDGLVHLGQGFFSVLEFFGQFSLPFLFLLVQHTSHPVLLVVLVFVELSVWDGRQKILDAKLTGHFE